MPTRILALLLPVFVLTGSIGLFVATDYSRSLRSVDAGEARSFSSYLAARLDGFTGRNRSSEEIAALEPEALKAETRGQPTEFACTSGVGGSKVCTALTR